VPLETGQAITVELADATVLVVDEGLCMDKLPLDDPDSNCMEDEEIDIPEGLISMLEFDIEVLRLETVLELVLNISKELLDMLEIVLEVDKTLVWVEVVDIVKVNVREAEDEVELGLLRTWRITCAPQTFVFELAAPTELFK